MSTRRVLGQFRDSRSLVLATIPVGVAAERVSDASTRVRSQQIVRPRAVIGVGVRRNPFQPRTAIRRPASYHGCARNRCTGLIGSVPVSAPAPTCVCTFALAHSHKMDHRLEDCCASANRSTFSCKAIAIKRPNAGRRFRARCSRVHQPATGDRPMTVAPSRVRESVDRPCACLECRVRRLPGARK